MKKVLLAIGLFLAGPLKPCAAFDLWQDLQSETKWRLGSSAQAGMAIAMRSDDSVNVKAGQYCGSALASLVDYRFLNLSAGGTFVPQNNGTLKALDTGKIGINLGYFLTDFVDEPPALLKNMVVGPSLSTTLVTTPHVFIPFFDLVLGFGGGSTEPVPPKEPPAPAPSEESRLNLPNWHRG
jgi:hypothetical protein